MFAYLFICIQLNFKGIMEFFDKCILLYSYDMNESTNTGRFAVVKILIL